MTFYLSWYERGLRVNIINKINQLTNSNFSAIWKLLRLLFRCKQKIRLNYLLSNKNLWTFLNGDARFHWLPRLINFYWKERRLIELIESQLRALLKELTNFFIFWSTSLQVLYDSGNSIIIERENNYKYNFRLPRTDRFLLAEKFKMNRCLSIDYQ